MNVNSIFETFLFLSPTKLIIVVYDKKSFEKVYYKESFNQNSQNKIDYKLVDFFLEKNIFEIEKQFKNFIKNIVLIIESNEFLKINISIKKDNYGNEITKPKLIHLLNEAKNECKKTLEGRKITNIVIDNYVVDKKNHPFFPEGMKSDFFSIDVSFVSLSINYFKNLEKILKKYQVSINRILQLEYIENFNKNDNEDFFSISMKILNGLNRNEVILVPKESRIEGFFERFFNFFN